jgi:hypothetical protein
MRLIIAPTVLRLTGTFRTFIYTHTHAEQVLLLYTKLFFLKFAVFTTGMGNFEMFMLHNSTLNSVALARKRTISNERPPLVGQVTLNFYV